MENQAVQERATKERLGEGLPKVDHSMLCSLKGNEEFRRDVYKNVLEKTHTRLKNLGNGIDQLYDTFSFGTRPSRTKLAEGEVEGEDMGKEEQSDSFTQQRKMDKSFFENFSDLLDEMDELHDDLVDLKEKIRGGA